MYRALAAHPDRIELVSGDRMTVVQARGVVVERQRRETARQRRRDAKERKKNPQPKAPKKVITGKAEPSGQNLPPRA